MKIAFAMFGDSSNINYSKGPGYYIWQSLVDRGEEVILVGGNSDSHLIFHKILTGLSLLLGKRYIRQRTKNYLKNAAKKIDAQLENIDYDIIFSFGSLPLAFLKSQKPKYFWTDTSFAGLIEYKHPHYLNLLEYIRKSGDEIETIVLNDSRLAFYASDWAVDCVLRNYQVDKNKIIKVPLGANIDSYPCAETIETFIDNRVLNKKERISLLLVGNNWINKGGPISVELVKKLNEMGINSELVVMGCTPKLHENDKQFVRVIGKLDKNKPEELAEFNSIFEQAFIFLMPTRADAYGHVFCEAGAFALPSIGTNVAGVPEIIKNKENGFTFDLDAPIDEIATNIASLYHNDDEYRRMSQIAYKTLQERFLWKEVTGEVLNHIYQDLGIEK